jgi:phage/plasmid-like protein (TIGR03299 family)
MGADGGFQPIQGKMATVREDNDQVLGIVGDDYEVFANSDLKGIIQPLVDEQVLTVVNQGYLNNGRKVFVQAQIAEDYKVVGESYKGMITLLNSHDGTTKVSLGTTVVRVICQNTFTAAMKQLTEKFRHSEGVTERVLESAAVVDYVGGAMKKYNEYAEKLAATRCTSAQFRDALEQIYQQPVDKMRDSFVSQLNNLFYNGRGNEGRTMYDALNACTEWSTHFSRKSKDARMNYSQFGAGAATNRRALAVLTEMATV